MMALLRHTKQTIAKFKHISRILISADTCICNEVSRRNTRQFSTTPDISLLRHLKTRIKLNGPVTVAEYMREVLTNPLMGYYMNRDVFGSEGDFITSPEISQMFGELIGIWCLNEWMQDGHTNKLQIVELGPGRGTLADDMLRVFSKFKEAKDSVSLHLVEVSPTLSAMQEAKLTGQDVKSMPVKPDKLNDNNKHYRECISKYGHPVYWYKTLSDVPRGLSCFVAHEFLDALPIHKFQKTDRGWCEVLVDSDDSSTSELRFVLSNGPTTALKVFLQVDPDDSRDHIEVCPESGIVIQELSSRINQDGGYALIADYGHNGEKTDTFRGFKKHQLHDVLKDPGSADLTADVDFAYLKKVTENLVKTYGPITQQTFLENMGIGVRLQVLLQKASTENWKDLISGYKMLTDKDKMGERFKFLAILKQKDSNYIPAGFVPPNVMNSMESQKIKK
ncbi:protein arginine methyltransferase NDUFAF7, mitochondrial-like isoform X2 [Gigantopelta aegis]|uniref:protein arginine methyltransferase NDUFAF7, mitochondrial-like isoform X2 n=1 Tax=Gigantopelta aegis TaxID=1735272 RepID=UPI001B88E716|nr:protein arginine methyltransferase NDUFAF7, mitochondrial-like isoform X2 [Gigantopelta aegis]